MDKEFNAKMKLLVKSEKALLKLEMQKKTRQMIMVAIALIAVLTALVMFNVTIYLFLDAHLSDLASAALLTGLNLLVAVIFLLMASRQELSAEAESINDMRDFAWGQVSNDFDEVKQGVTEFKESIYRVKGNVDSVIHKDLLGGIMPILQILMQVHKKRKKSTSDEAE